MSILELNFNLGTFTHSDTALRNNIQNIVDTDEQFENLQKLHKLLVHIHSRLSTKYAKPIQIRINSAYRNKRVNELVGGVPTSEHCKGLAADTVAVGLTLDEYFDQVKSLVKDNVISVGQCIKEYGKLPDRETDDWLHISVTTANHKNEFMIKRPNKPYEHITI
jgi:zinc D-Ala-D-Ala carboxypeptidase